MTMTKKIRIGNVVIGGGNRVAIQSMTTASVADIDATVAQINALSAAGCDIVRAAINNDQDAKAIRKVKEKINIPFVADIQFDYKLAIKSIENGADKIRINPGNIGGEEKIKIVADCAKAHNIPIRVGVNSGSIENELLQKYGRTPKALAESALKNIALLEKTGFEDIVVSLKSSSVKSMVESCRYVAGHIDYPQHLGVTEAGLYDKALVKSAVGIGSLLLDGIGDTIRVSVTGEPVTEIRAAKEILRAVGLDKNYAEIISCPTCSRCTVDLFKLTTELTHRTENINFPVKIAVMGCAVNGPGEAKDADFGVACGGGKGLIFEKGNIIKTVEEDKLIDELMSILERFSHQGI